MTPPERPSDEFGTIFAGQQDSEAWMRACCELKVWSQTKHRRKWEARTKKGLPITSACRLEGLLIVSTVSPILFIGF